MKALLLNSGVGRRMGPMENHCKCLLPVLGERTILDLQLAALEHCGIEEVVITTGPFEQILMDHVGQRFPHLKVRYVHNPLYETTNYIYSIYMARELLEGEELVLMHGDLVFQRDILESLLSGDKSRVVVDSTLPLPEKDFKAVIQEGKVKKIGIEFFDNAAAAQPLYYLRSEDWGIWLEEIVRFCQEKNTGVYAENALNLRTEEMDLGVLDIQGRLCMEVDNGEDLQHVRSMILGKERSFS